MKFRKIVAMMLTAAVLSSSAVTGCGSAVDTSAAAATLDGREISMGIANLMAQCQAAQMEGYLLSYYGEDMWSQDSGSGDGLTMAESLKDSVMENLQDYYLLDAHTGDYDVSLTDEEKDAITKAAEKFIADNNSDTLKAMSATQETVEEMLRLYKIQAKMRTAITDTIDKNVSDEECAQKTFSYVKFDKSDDSSADTTAQETPSDPKADAEAFLKDADDMESAAEKAEYTVSKCSYGAGDLSEDDNSTSMELDVLKAADKLKDGELAKDLVETDSAYYVIRMDSTDDKDAAETKKNSILSQRRNEKYDEVLEGYKEGCKWEINEEAWEQVNFDELYTIKSSKSDTAADDGSTGSTADDGSTGGTAADDGSAASDDSSTGSTAADDKTGSAAADDNKTGNTAADDAAQQ